MISLDGESRILELAAAPSERPPFLYVSLRHHDDVVVSIAF